MPRGLHQVWGQTFLHVVQLVCRNDGSQYSILYKTPTTLQLTFLSKICGYIAAYKYICKLSEILHSPGHNNLQDVAPTSTKKAMKAFSAKSRKRRSHHKSIRKIKINWHFIKKCNSKKQNRSSNTHVSDFLVANNIHIPRIRVSFHCYITSLRRSERPLKLYYQQTSQGTCRPSISYMEASQSSKGCTKEFKNTFWYYPGIFWTWGGVAILCLGITKKQ